MTFVDVLTHDSILRPKGRGIDPQVIELVLADSLYGESSQFIRKISEDNLGYPSSVTLRKVLQFLNSVTVIWKAIAQLFLNSNLTR